MTQNFNFDVNIEKRMPDTGKVFMVDRMTSDYAKAHPFDVDGFVHDVAVKHGADEERVRLFFNYGLGKMGEKFSTHCPCKHKDKVKVDKRTGIGELIFGEYPPYVNGPEPALVESWLKGVDYHTKGLRMGDVLPAVAPACKITRLDDGEWIALFPKDMVLLDTNCHESTTNESSCVPMVASDKSITTFVPTTDNTDDTDNIESVNNQCDPVMPSEQNNAPVELDLFAQMKMELDQLREENERLRCNMTQERAAACSPMTREGQEPSDIEDGQRCSSPCVSQPSIPRQRPRRTRRQKQDVMQLYSTPAITVDHTMEGDHSERNKKIFAAVATAVVFVVMVNTVGLFGIAALGLLAGGLIK